MLTKQKLWVTLIKKKLYGNTYINKNKVSNVLYGKPIDYNNVILLMNTKI